MGWAGCFCWSELLRNFAQVLVGFGVEQGYSCAEFYGEHKAVEKRPHSVKKRTGFHGFRVVGSSGECNRWGWFDAEEYLPGSTPIQDHPRGVIDQLLNLVNVIVGDLAEFSALGVEPA